MQSDLDNVLGHGFDQQKIGRVLRTLAPRLSEILQDLLATTGNCSLPAGQGGRLSHPRWMSHLAGDRLILGISNEFVDGFAGFAH
jgi:hypothetical protein